MIFKIKPISKNGIFNDLLRIVVNHCALDFTTFVKKSTANNSGDGVFISGVVKKHQLVSLYPGVYEPPPPALAVLSADGEHCISPDDLSLRSESCYRIHCNSCGGYLDAAKSAKGFDSKFSSIIAPYVVGHMINHPPKGVKPNVFPVDFYWTEFLDHVRCTVRPDDLSQAEVFVDSINNIDSSSGGVWYVDPVTLEAVPLTANCSPKVGIAIVATDDIKCNATEGTELWMDYRFNMKGTVPAWYSPVNYQP